MNRKADFFEGLHVILTWLMRFASVNILWFATNLPILFLLFNFILGNGSSMLLLLLLIACHILLCYPSMMALFAVVNQWLTEQEQEDGSIFKNYVSAFLVHYKKSIPSGTIWTAIIGIWLIDYAFFSQISSILEGITLIIGALLFCMAMLYVALSVQDDDDYGVLEKLKLSLRFTLTQPLVFLSIVLSFIFLWWMSIYLMWFAIPFFIISFHAFLVLAAYYKWIAPSISVSLGENYDDI